VPYLPYKKLIITTIENSDSNTTEKVINMDSGKVIAYASGNATQKKFDILQFVTLYKKTN
jgi:hypothetical protein